MKLNLKRQFAHSMPHAVHSTGSISAQRVLVLLIMLSVIFTGCKKMQKDGTAGSGPDMNNGKLKTNTVSNDFIVATLPDTQYYTDTLGINDHAPQYLLTNGVPAMLQSQIDWIKNNRVDSNIVYVAGLGDIVDHGDDTVAHPHEWKKASQIIYGLETPYTGFPQGIPYGLAVGNHDQTPNGHPLTGTTTKYNSYFGYSRFSPRGYYGDRYGTNNDSHYDFFSVDGIGYLVVFVEYDDTVTGGQDNGDMLTWAYNVIGGYLSRRVIIVSHSMLFGDGTFTPQGQRTYDRLKTRKNIFLMLGGHVPGVGAYRQDTYDGHTITTLLSDWQSRSDGGGGIMRTVKVSVANDLLSFRAFTTYSSTVFPSFTITKPLFHQETATRKCDFNKDGKTELGFFNAGVWKINGMSNHTNGVSGDIQAPADYNGDGKTDYGFYRPSNQTWYTDGVVANTVFGDATGDVPVPGDYDGDGNADFAFWRASTSEWVVNGSAAVAWGTAGDVPVPGDYDGDGKVDFATYRESNHTWYVKGQTSVNYGITGDVPVPGDYKGDGKTDYAQFRTSTGVWYVLNFSNTIVCVTPAAGDIPAPGDYDGLGRTQPAVYRPSNHTLYVYHWDTGTITTVNFAGSASGDKILNLPVSIRRIYYP